MEIETVAACVYCLKHTPSQDLINSYPNFDDYCARILNECFAIGIEFGDKICSDCYRRLMDAHDFKNQILSCQQELSSMHNVLQSTVEMKEEISQLENDLDGDSVFLLHVEDEPTKFNDDENKRKLQQLLNRRDITIKKTNQRESKTSDHNGDIICPESGIVRKKILIPSSLRAYEFENTENSKNTKSTENTESLQNVEIEDDSEDLTYEDDWLDPKQQETTTKDEHLPAYVKILRNVKTLLTYSNCVPFLDKTLVGIVCAHCKELCSNSEELRQHNFTLHQKDEIPQHILDMPNRSVKMDVTDLKCQICDQQMICIDTLRRHLTSQHNVKFFTDVPMKIFECKFQNEDGMNCALCKESFSTFRTLKVHMNVHYTNYVCESCGASFMFVESYRQHVKGNKCLFKKKDVVTSEQPKKVKSKPKHLKCLVCSQYFTSLHKRNSHMIRDHKLPHMYKCKECNRNFVVKGRLNEHIRKVHYHERNYKCEYCGAVFFTNHDLKNHLVCHTGERIFRCDICERTYPRKATLRFHMKVHEEKKHMCCKCGLDFTYKSGLKNHMLKLHGIDIYADKEMTEENSVVINNNKYT